jgi:methionyl-tRNA synthetase
MSKVLVFAPPPTPNGDLHVGHLSGPYLRADIFARYCRMEGRDTYYLSGIDEHQSYTALKGRQIGLGPQETADQFAAKIEQTLAAADIKMDLIARPSRSACHEALVIAAFERLKSDGKLIEKEEPCLFCEICQLYLFEAYVRGLCPHCGAPSGGNSCEVCGQPNDCRDLGTPTCNICGAPANLRPFTRFYFPLSRYEGQLREYFEKATMSPRIKQLGDKMLGEGLPEVAVTHPANWGISVPGLPEQKMYVWFEMALGLISATQELASRMGAPLGWERFWKSDDVEIVKFLGFDNAYFYSILFPAIFMAVDSKIRPPQVLIVNEFYCLEGAKFSTSRNHAIWGRDFLCEEHTDLVRFYLAYSGPETEQTSFSIPQYDDTVRREIIDGLQPWLSELGTLVVREYDSIAPAPATWTNAAHNFYREIVDITAKAANSYTAKCFSTQRAARLLLELVREARTFGETEKLWRPLPGQRQTRDTSIALELLAAKALALMAAPIMPSFAASLWRDLGQTGSIEVDSWQGPPAWVCPGTTISKLDKEHFENYENSQFSHR